MTANKRSLHVQVLLIFGAWLVVGALMYLDLSIGLKLVVFVMLTILSATLFYKMGPQKIPKQAPKILISLISIVGVELGTLGIDRLAGAVVTVPGVIYIPGTQGTVHTSEFDYSFRINNLGFRGEDVNLDETRLGCRVLLLGDSFTYGWGLNENVTWAALVQQQLGDHARLFNLGIPGGGPVDYTTIARIVIPLLKPDLVVINVLQADDFMQTMQPEPKLPLRFSSTPNSIILKLLNANYPNLMTLLLSRKPLTAEDNQRTWRADVSELLRQFTPQQRARFEALPDHLKALYTDGLLNPGLLHQAFTSPDYLLEPIDPEGTGTQETYNKRLDLLADSFKTIASLVQGKQILVNIVPNQVYVELRSWKSRQLLGYNMTMEMLTTPRMDDEIRAAVLETGDTIPILSSTDAFRQDQSGPNFYELDGHLNEKGAKLFADLIAPSIAQMCKQTRPE